MRFVPKFFYNRLETSMPLTDPVKKKQFIFWENELTGRRRLFKLLPEDEAGFPRVWAVTDIRRCARMCAQDEGAVPAAWGGGGHRGKVAAGGACQLAWRRRPRQAACAGRRARRCCLALACAGQRA
jgi:hypothetical protein